VAGWPSIRELVKSIDRHGASRDRVHAAFTQSRLPSWELLKVLVEELAARVPEGSESAVEVRRFHRLWVAGSARACDAAPAGATGPEPAAISQDNGMSSSRGGYGVAAAASQPSAWSLRSAFASLNLRPPNRVGPLEVASLAFLGLGIGMAFGLGKGLANHFDGLASYATVSAGFVAALVLRTSILLRAGIALTVVLITSDIVNKVFLGGILEGINSTLSGILAGVAVWLAARDTKSFTDRLRNRETCSIWLGVLLTMLCIAGFRVTGAMRAGHGHLMSSFLWAAAVAICIGAGVLLRSRSRPGPATGSAAERRAGSWRDGSWRDGTADGIRDPLGAGDRAVRDPMPHHMG